MLEPWIIEEIRRREQEQEEYREQPRIEAPRYDQLETEASPEEDNRGVVIIETQ